MILIKLLKINLKIVFFAFIKSETYFFDYNIPIITTAANSDQSLALKIQFNSKKKAIITIINIAPKLLLKKQAG